MDVRAALLRPTLAFLFPDACLACGAPLCEGEPGLCPDCARALAPALAVVELPRHAALPDPGEGRALAAFALDLTGPARALVHALKYGGRTSAARTLAGAAERVLSPWVGQDVDAIVPVPLHAVRQRERGFNQAELLARHLSTAFRAPVAASWLQRCRPTRAQAELSREERFANVAGAFRAGPAAAAGGAALLLDDVVTTGATLAAAANELARVGVRPVCCAVAGRRLRADGDAPGLPRGPAGRTGQKREAG